MTDVVVASFNAHWGVGRFGGSRSVPYDLAGAVRSLSADVVVLPEAWRPHEGECALDILAGEGWHVEERPFATLRFLPRPEVDVPGDGWWSLAVLSRYPISERRDIPLARVFHDPVRRRAAIAVTLDVEGTEVALVAVHASSRLWYAGPGVHLCSLRRHLLLGNRPSVIAGDCNLWGPGVVALLPGWRRAVRGSTYPAHRPHSQIDHILVHGGVEIIGGEVLPVTGLSDHRPVRARLRFLAPSGDA